VFRSLGARVRWLLQHIGVFAQHYSSYARLMRLHKPIGIWLLLWPTLWALWIASSGRPDQQIFVVFVLGTIVTRSAGCIINDFADRKIDGHVRRTRDRPLATGEVAVPEALALFAGLMFIALGLALTLNSLTQVLAVAVPMAFAAERAAVDRLGWLMFFAAIVWGVIYDTQYAMADRDDDLKIGVPSTAILFGDLDRVFIALMQLMFLASLALIGKSALLGSWYYAGVALAAAFALRQQYLIKDQDPNLCLRAFHNNAWLGGVVFAGILLDFLFRS
jgi:4-hydroxybenzoate polyprenyltransferase